jgi:hypothetical protein
MRIGIALGLAVAAAIAIAVVVLASGGSSSPATTLAATTLPATTSTTVPPVQPAATGDGELAEGPAVLYDDLALVTKDWQTDWDRRTIDTDELLIGIFAPDPRDVIRPIDTPLFQDVASIGDLLQPREPGAVLEVDGEARFYPLRIMTAHEIVNDEIAGIPVAVTYCPLCNTAAVFDRRVEGTVLRFGVSGLLRNSDLVMWDSATDSLWQQITGEGIVGRFAGTQLEFLPTALVRWEDFRSEHPDGQVLALDQGLPGYNYGRNPYEGYSSRSAPFGFFQDDPDPRFPALERVVGIRVAESTKAYPFSIIAAERVVNDVFEGVPVVVFWGAADTADALDADQVADGQAVGTGIAFSPVVDGQTLTFTAVDDTTFRDDQTGSLWSLLGTAIDGPLTGSELGIIIHQNEFWFAWSAFNEGAPVYDGAAG